MVRLTVLYNKPSDVQAFDQHYRDVHIPLAKRLPDLKRFTVSKGVTAMDFGEALYLIAELDWDDLATMQSSIQSPEGNATTADFAANLAPLSPNTRMMAYEVEEV